MAPPLRHSALLALGLAGCFQPTGYVPGDTDATGATTGAAATDATTDATTGPLTSAAATTLDEPTTAGTTDEPGETSGSTAGSVPVCGDGLLDPATEECDDGILTDTAGCAQCRRSSFRVFVTASPTLAVLGGVADADALCQGEAAAAQLQGTYRAWISDSQSSPLTRFGKALSRPYVRLDGLAIAGTWDIMVTAGLSQPISLTAYGVPITADTPCVNDFVWTGTDMSGLPWGDMFCAEWTSDTSDISVAVGSALSAVSPDWTLCNSASCGTLARLYCFEQALD